MFGVRYFVMSTRSSIVISVCPMFSCTLCIVRQTHPMQNLGKEGNVASFAYSPYTSIAYLPACADGHVIAQCTWHAACLGEGSPFARCLLLDTRRVWFLGATR